MINRITDRSGASVSDETAKQKARRSIFAPKPRRKVLQYAVMCAVFLVSFYYVGHKLVQGAAEVWVSNLSIDYIRLSLSIVLTSVCTVLGGWEWSMLLGGLGVRLPIRKSLKVHLLSIPPKYIPGFAWQLAGKAYLCRAAGATAKATAISMAGELVIILLSGILILLLFMPVAALPRDNLALAFAFELPLPTIAVVYGLAVPFLLQKAIVSRLGQRIVGRGIHFSYERLLFIFVSVALTWILSGLGFFLLSTSLYPAPISSFPSFVFAITASFVVSLLAFFVPLGLGVREAVLTFLLCLWIPAPVAALVAIAARLVLATGEIAAFLLALRL